MKKVLPMLLIVVTMFSIVPNVEAETLQSYIDKVNKHTAELEASQSQLDLNQEEINKIQIEIKNIKEEIVVNKAEQEELAQQIEENNIKIKEKEKETKNLINYSGKNGGFNADYEYIFGADDLTDMIYRAALVEQLSEYNEKVIDELTAIIKDNDEKKNSLEKKNEELGSLESSLKEKEEAINEDSENIREGMPDIEKQIEEAQDMVDFYKNKGCEPADEIGVDCAVIKPVTPSTPGASGSNIPSTGAFVRPMEVGYITSSFGPRSLDGFHHGIDLGNSANRYNTKIYPIADGVIYDISYDIYGALTVRIAHNYGGKIVASTYVHLASFAPGIYEGMEISKNQYIGIMGNTGYSFGEHLHLEVSDCPYLYAGSKCTSWSAYTSYIRNNNQNPQNYISIPSSFSVR